MATTETVALPIAIESFRISRIQEIFSAHAPACDKIFSAAGKSWQEILRSARSSPSAKSQRARYQCGGLLARWLQTPAAWSARFAGRSYSVGLEGIKEGKDKKHKLRQRR
jgi:hypothetical protein